MNYPSWAPLSFHPDAPPSPSPPPPITPILHSQQAVPPQRVPRQQIFTCHSHADTHSASYTHSTLICNAFPSAEQRTAIHFLQGIDIPTILAWLNGFRSLHNGEQGFDPSHLSPQQRQAVSTLIGCSSGLVQTWLNNARSPGQYRQTM